MFVGVLVVASGAIVLVGAVITDPRTVRQERAAILGDTASSATRATDVNLDRVGTHTGIQNLIIEVPNAVASIESNDVARPARGGDPTQAREPFGIQPAAATATSIVDTGIANDNDFAQVTELTRSGVLRIESTRCPGRTGRQGTGFLIAPDLVATAAHVVENARFVTIHDGLANVAGTVVGFDASTDLALVRLDDPDPKDDPVGHVFTAGDAASIEEGRQIVALGYPRTRGFTASPGDVVAIHKDVVIGVPSRQDYLETTARLVPGNSGGPLVDQSGQVVGLAVSVLADDKSTSFAVVADEAWAAFDRWIDRPAPPPAPTCGGSASE